MRMTATDTHGTSWVDAEVDSTVSITTEGVLLSATNQSGWKFEVRLTGAETFAVSIAVRDKGALAREILERMPEVTREEVKKIAEEAWSEVFP